MAKQVTIKIYELSYTDSPQLSTLFFDSGSKTKAVLSDPESGDRLIFEGRNFKYEEGKIVSGTIDKMVLTDDKGRPFQEFSDLNLNAGFVAGAEDMLDFASYVYYWAQSGDVRLIGTNLDDELATQGGKDKLLGRGGSDALSGGLGKDMLTGGKGNDTFVFAEGFGKDAITDFDALGGAGAQDLIDAVYADIISISNSGKNTVIDFGEGDVLTLLNVKKSDVDETDFAML